MTFFCVDILKLIFLSSMWMKKSIIFRASSHPILVIARLRKSYFGCVVIIQTILSVYPIYHRF